MVAYSLPNYSKTYFYSKGFCDDPICILDIDGVSIEMVLFNNSEFSQSDYWDEYGKRTLFIKQ